jgi:hypothetical protein
MKNNLIWRDPGLSAQDAASGDSEFPIDEPSFEYCSEDMITITLLTESDRLLSTMRQLATTQNQWKWGPK